MLVRPNPNVRPVPRSPRPLAKSWDEIAELCTLCAEGKLYEVEAWIKNGRPIQCEPSTDRKHWKLRSPLRLAVERGFYSLVELLLLNGYNPNSDSWSCQTPAVEAKNRSLIDLLLKHGTDPHGVDLYDVLETYDREIMDRFIAAGFDPCRDNAMAEALLCKARPLLDRDVAHTVVAPGCAVGRAVGLGRRSSGAGRLRRRRSNRHRVVPAFHWRLVRLEQRHRDVDLAAVG
jgi:hypothetical protein